MVASRGSNLGLELRVRSLDWEGCGTEVGIFHYFSRSEVEFMSYVGFWSFFFLGEVAGGIVVVREGGGDGGTR